jgi:MFS superfamily sulfate permease-like transporter
MTTAKSEAGGFRFPILQGVLPIKGGQIPAEIVAGITLAALAIPEVMGYTKISGTPVITGLYTILIPMALFAVFGSFVSISCRTNLSTCNLSRNLPKIVILQP